ncbi:BgTH12-06850 [Blumeria graminis f. sp. triticale]|uniref:BgTH12-06850 n=1 Tax=Blumeria graminis f. sp. triticale TaxID=1689686 RepID=A0A9W4D851_BLUGR|nr:BgTH12-06850 [Blumeria graminis f. sp. triticale]
MIYVGMSRVTCLSVWLIRLSNSSSCIIGINTCLSESLMRISIYFTLLFQRTALSQMQLLGFSNPGPTHMYLTSYSWLIHLLIAHWSKTTVDQIRPHAISLYSEPYISIQLFPLKSSIDNLI